MKLKLFFAFLMGAALLFTVVLPATADGIIIPRPTPCPLDRCEPIPMRQLTIKYHHVDVTIDNQIAVTHVDQVFSNPNAWVIEGTYVFPLPQDAVVTNFKLWVDGKPVEGKVLDADQARQVYEDIVRKQRDPALLEYIGRGAVQANIFPIQPGDERRIELEYRQVLTAENGLVRYNYPLNTEKFSREPLQSVSITVQVVTSQPIRAVYSPTHSVALDRKSDTQVTASYEANNVLPDSDFSLFYSIGQSEAFHLFSYRDPSDPNDPNGFFMLLLAPKPDVTTQAISKDVLLVLDRSGSMDGEKFQQAQQALKFILNHLNKDDRFYLTTFSSDIETFADHLSPAGEAANAAQWVDRLSAAGSTDINRALLETAAVADKERPTYLIFLTDGLPTEGVTDSKEILNNFGASAPKNIRLFTFGVGYDVDTYLLDSLAQEHHGLSTYVKPGDALKEILSSFYSRISTPVLTNLNLSFGSFSTIDIYPNPLPDLFEGTQVVITGRYRVGGSTEVVLTGLVNGQTQTFRFPAQQFTNDSRGSSSALTSLPRLWATRKIGYLLNLVRLKGPDKETIDQIVAISIRYGIVTPYTSYLVTEPMPLGAESQRRMAEDTYNQAQSQAPSVSGQAAVEKAAGEGALSNAEVAPGAPQSNGGQTVRVVGSRTFVLNNGVWTDTRFDPAKNSPIQISFLSTDYFKFAQSRPEIGAALALGERVILLVDGKAYEIVSAGTQTPSLTLPVQPTQPAVRRSTSTHEAGITPAAVGSSQPTAQSSGNGTVVWGIGVLMILLFFGTVFLVKR